MEPGDLPQFDNGQTYLLTGETLNTLVRFVKESRIVIVPGSGLKIDEVGADGTRISIDGVECP
jgi:RNase P/RNase MRP subunit p29